MSAGAIAKALSAKSKKPTHITIAGEPVYFDMPEDETKVHADRIYLKKHYLPEVIMITDEIKEMIRAFIATKKVGSCQQEHLDILRTALTYRLHTIEAEADKLKDERGDSVPLRERLGHAQKLRDLLEPVNAEILLCANKQAAAARKKAQEEADAAAAAADNRIGVLQQRFFDQFVKWRRRPQRAEITSSAPS